MVTIEAVRKLALAFEEVVELPHFDKTSFRVNKKIFATVDMERNLVCLLLKPADQSVFCCYDKTVVYPVPNKWGLKGATFVELKKVRKEMLKDGLTVAYCTVAPKRLAEKYRDV